MQENFYLWDESIQLISRSGPICCCFCYFYHIGGTRFTDYIPRRNLKQFEQVKPVLWIRPVDTPERFYTKTTFNRVLFFFYFHRAYNFRTSILQGLGCSTPGTSLTLALITTLQAKRNLRYQFFASRLSWLVEELRLTSLSEITLLQSGIRAWWSACNLYSR